MPDLEPDLPADRHGDARLLLAAKRDGVLSTLSLEEAGFPFGSVVPYCLDRTGRPVILISDIAQHTRNIEADPRLCLTVVAGGDDVQASGRLSLLARGERVAAGPGLDDAAERYYRYFPSARGYHQAHGFAFYRLAATRLRWIGGFGDIRWIAPDEALLANPFSREQEAAIVGHMNADHAEAMRHYCRSLAGLPVATEEEVTMTGIDAEGFDLRIESRPLRLTFPDRVATPAEARQRLVAMARG